MTKEFCKVAAALAIACVLPGASATVLTFDDLPGTGANFFTSNYGGFQFGTNNIANTAWFYTDEKSNSYKPQSGTKFIATDYQLYAADGSYQPTQAISSTTPFVFNGAYFSDSPAFDTPDSISYQLYLGPTLVYTSPLSAPLVATPQFVASGFNGLVNSVVISGQQGYFGLDNFTYNEPPTTPIPEPETYALMVAGLAAVMVAIRRRRSI